MPLSEDDRAAQALRQRRAWEDKLRHSQAKAQAELEEMRALAEAGDNYDGNDDWIRLMRRVGRGS